LGRGPLDFVVISVPRQASAPLIREVVQRGTPVLAETPPATDRDELTDLYSQLGAASPVQVAEQYQFQPQHAARLEAVRAGLIGAVGSTRVSVAHGYHAVSLIRLILGVGFSDALIDGSSIRDRVLSGRGRDAWSETLGLTDSSRVTARLRFDTREGVYEFNGQQYFSPIRSRHLAIYGERGEIVDGTISYFKAAGHAVHLNIQREECGADGDLEGYFLRQVTAGDHVVYRNPFAPARLSDDELAVAEVMARMSSFVDGGPAFYGLADACHDHYLSLLIDEAVASGEVVYSKPQVWTSAQSAAGGA
jgi:predicted dehydrogenase